MKNKNLINDYAIKFVGKNVNIIIDRPLHSKHPKYKFIYEVNYGFVPGTHAPDGEEIDAYLLRINSPIKSFKGKCIAVIHRLNDDDDKLVVVPPSVPEMTDKEIRQATYFQEKFFNSKIIREISP